MSAVLPPASRAVGLLRRAVLVWRQLWHSMSIYLPVVLMGLLALGTWWLAQNTPALALAEPNKPVKHEADYFLRNFAIKNFDAQGQLASEVTGEKARHFGDTDVLEIDNARIQSWKQGRLSNASATRAVSNGDGSEVQLIGNAVLLREPVKDENGKEIPRMEFRSDFLHIFVNEERLTSNKPVTIKHGADSFSADNMTYNNLDRVAELQGRVKVQLVPTRAR